MSDLEERLRIVEDVLGLEPDDSNDDDNFDYEENWEREQEELVNNCNCGAWKMSSSGEAILIADCCC